MNLDCEVIVGDKSYKESEILEWKRKAENYDKLTKNPIDWYIVGMKEATKRIYELEKENNQYIEEHQRFDRLKNLYNNEIDKVTNLTFELVKFSQDKKVLVDGVKCLLDNIEGIEKDHCPAYDGFPAFDFYRFGFENDGEHDINNINDDGSPNDYYYKIKAMLELVEEQE